MTAPGSARRRWLLAGLVGAGLVTLFAWQADHARLLLEASHFTREPAELRVPVSGLAVERLHSSWHAPRSGGREHQGADLFAERGTPVVSASEGVVWRVGVDSLGGNVVWVLGEGRSLYYYAHLHRQAEGLYLGMPVHRGTVLGLVGNTGNAMTTPPHLHFGVYRVGWTGLSAVDPVPLLQRLVPARHPASVSGRTTRSDGRAATREPTASPRRR